MTETIHATAAASETPAGPIPTVTVAFRQPLGEPIILESKGKKKKLKGGSKQLRDAQRTEARFAKISEKAARALAQGAETYNDARKKSAGDRADGPTRDFLPNMAEGLSESIRRASSIPVDVADALNTKTARGMLRNQMRMMRAGMRLWRF